MTRPDSHSDASPSGFPGFGEDAPLDLSGLTASAEAAVVGRLVDGSFPEFADAAAAVGYCSRPVRLVGTSTTVDATTGEVLGTFSSEDAPLGVLHRPCGNRRAEVCPSCSRVYARDTYVMLNAGLAGGKTIPEPVKDNPLLFVTFTAPSFGHVHGPRQKAGEPVGGRCRPRAGGRVCQHGRLIGCMQVHGQDDPANGSPLCEDCYDWRSAVVWQWWSSAELFRRTMQNIRRALAATLDVSQTRLGTLASVQYAKVAEYQARGLVHFHVLIRLDGGDGPGSPAPLDGGGLAKIVTAAAHRTTFTAPPVGPHDKPRELRWGNQLDIKTVRDGHRTDDPDGPMSADQVAGYLAKYATKDANSIRDLGEPRAHLSRMGNVCRELHQASRQADRLRWWLLAQAIRQTLVTGSPALASTLLRLGAPANPYALLPKWAHMLGFRGHFSSKSRAYSVTLGQLRRARQRFQALVTESRRTGQPLDTRDLEARLLADDEEETTLVIGSWTYQGSGWTNPGDEAMALQAAALAREYDKWKAGQRKTA